MHTVSFKVAMKLKEAGYPQPEDGLYYDLHTEKIFYEIGIDESTPFRDFMFTPPLSAN